MYYQFVYPTFQLVHRISSLSTQFCNWSIQYCNRFVQYCVINIGHKAAAQANVLMDIRENNGTLISLPTKLSWVLRVGKDTPCVDGLKLYVV